MLKIVRRRLDVQFDSLQAFEFQRQVDSSLSPLINGVRREYFKRLGLGNEETEEWLLNEHRKSTVPLLLGDIILRDDDTVMYYRQQRSGGPFEAGVITRNEPSDYADYFDTLLKIVRKTTERKDLAWLSAGPDAEVSQSLANESEVRVPTAREVEASRELENEAAQRLLSQIMSASSVFLARFSQGLSQDRAVTERFVKRFEDLGIVSKDYAVLCRKTGQQILRVSSRAAIEDPSQKTFKCFICGNSVSEEMVDEIITPTEFGRKLIDHDYWLVVRVLGALESAGIANQQVHIHTGEGNLTNFFVTINDQLYLIVVANRKVTLEESYLINAHVAAYRLEHVIVIATERISVLMRHHLEKSNAGSEFDFLDSLRGVEERLMSIFSRKEKTVLKAVMSDFGTLTPVSIQDAVMEHISPPGDVLEIDARGRSTSMPRPAATVEPTPSKTESAATQRNPSPATEHPEPPPESHEAVLEMETPDADFSMMGEILEVDETMMPPV